MINITTSDLMMVAGSFGLKMDYSVRFGLKLKDEVNSEMLRHAVEKTQKRYPYLSLRFFFYLFHIVKRGLFSSLTHQYRDPYLSSSKQIIYHCNPLSQRRFR